MLSPNFGLVPQALRDAVTFARQVVADGCSIDGIAITGRSLGAAAQASAVLSLDTNATRTWLTRA